MPIIAKRKACLQALLFWRFRLSGSPKWTVPEIPGPAKHDAVRLTSGYCHNRGDAPCWAGDGSVSVLRLVPFTIAALQAIEPWFDDPETCRWVGDRRWPSMMLRLAASPPAEHRGQRVLDRRAWTSRGRHTSRCSRRREV